MSDLVQRLRADIEQWEGHYSGDMLVRYYPAPPLQVEAANRIEALERQLLANNPLIDEAIAQLEADEELMRQALEFCEFAWRDVPMNDHAFERLEQTMEALRIRLQEKKRR